MSNYRQKVIMFDLDGVICDFYHGYRGIQEKLGIPVTMSDNWDDYHDPRVWAAVESSDVFWARRPCMIEQKTCDRIATIALRTQNTVVPYFVTGRSCGIQVFTQTKAWLRLTLGIIDPQIIITDRKGNAAVALDAVAAIDDKAGNAVHLHYATEGRTMSFVINRPWNQFDQRVIGTKVRRVDSVDEYLDYVARMTGEDI